MKKRLDLKIRAGDLETTQTQALAYAGRANDSCQRTDMALDQQSKLTVPLVAEYPYFCSNMMQDMFVRCSVIRKRRGKIKLIHKSNHQYMNCYIYRLNGVIHVLETDKFHTTTGFSVKLKTDLDNLKIGEEYDISDEEENFCLTYPSQYDPITDTVGVGRNMRTVITTNNHNAADSCLVSQSFCNAFTCLRHIEIKIELGKKTIISRYPNLFPEIGTIVQDDTLFKIVSNTGEAITLGQNPDIPSGFEDEQIRIDANSFMTRVEVYSNNPCEDPILEKYRLELLEYRKNIYNVLSKFKDKEMSEGAIILRENYKYDKFRINNVAIDDPYIKMTFYTIDIPVVGYKFTCQSGGKYTIQKIFRDGEYVDDLGRNIDVLYISQSLIARSIAAPLFEIFHTGVMDFLKYKVENNLITPKETKEFLYNWHKMLGMEKEHKYIGMTADEIYQFIKESFPVIVCPPYTNKFDLVDTVPMAIYAKEKLGYELRKTYHKEDDGTFILQTEKHEVGYMWFNRQKNDPYEANSSISIAETNSKGYPVEKSSAKKSGRAIMSKSAQKLDILTLENLMQQAPTSVMVACLGEAEGGGQGGIYAIPETLIGAGIGLTMDKQPERNEEYESEYE